MVVAAKIGVDDVKLGGKKILEMNQKRKKWGSQFKFIINNEINVTPSNRGVLLLMIENPASVFDG